MFYIAVLAKELGLSDIEIGTIATLYGLCLLFSNYMFGSLSDILGTRQFLVSGFLFSSGVFLAHLFAFNYSSLLYIRILTGIALGVYPAALFSLAFNTNARMGRFSSYGALGSFAGLTSAGFLSTVYGTKSLFVLGSIAFFLAFVVSIGIREHRSVSDQNSLHPLKVVMENLPTYVALLIRHTGANIIWTFWSLYLIALGANSFYIGMITASNALTQFLTMRYLCDKLDSRREFNSGLLMSAALFLALGFATSFWQLWPLFALIGVVWGFVFVGAVRTVVDHSSQRGAAIGLLNSVLNMSSVLGPVLATVVIVFGDYRTTMYVGAILSFASYLISRRLNSPSHTSFLP